MKKSNTISFKPTKHPSFQEFTKSCLFPNSLYLSIHPSVMEDKKDNTVTASIEDEKQFTDLLFGDLEDFSFKVLFFGSNLIIAG